MADSETITVQPNGPYVVTGGVALRRKQPVISEHGEPLTWQTSAAIDVPDAYALCRCGGSGNKPFCDGTHNRAGFDGTESAPTEPYAQRAKRYEGTGIVVVDDRRICEHAGFCGNRITNVWKMTPQTADSVVRAQVIAMVERCPSGALTYEIDGNVIEPDVPVEIAVVTDGPLWVTGCIAVQRSDGAPLEARPRVTLCRCGGSANKPLCDGTHKEIGFRG
jgi:CDGSH-type Zn-finger protein